MILQDLILNLFVEQRVLISHIISPDFDMAFNVDSNNSTEIERMEVIQNLINYALITQSDDGYLGLTAKGGKFWESKFLIDWNLYCELFTIGDYEYSYFYACDIKQVELFIQNSQGLLDGIDIQVAEDWQPIYWKEPFSGFYLKIPIDIEELGEIFRSIPKYNIRHEYLCDE